ITPVPIPIHSAIIVQSDAATTPSASIPATATVCAPISAPRGTHIDSIAIPTLRTISTRVIVRHTTITTTAATTATTTTSSSPSPPTAVLWSTTPSVALVVTSTTGAMVLRLLVAVASMLLVAAIVVQSVLYLGGAVVAVSVEVDIVRRVLALRIFLRE